MFIARVEPVQAQNGEERGGDQRHYQGNDSRPAPRAPAETAAGARDARTEVVGTEIEGGGLGFGGHRALADRGGGDGVGAEETDGEDDDTD